MPKFHHTSGLAVLALSCVIALLRCSGNPAAPETCVIRGTVTNAADNTPLPNAVVTTNPTTNSSVADSLGRYSITGVAAGEYSVEAYLDGFEPSVLSIAIATDQTDTVNLQMSANVLTTPASPLIDTVVAGDSSVSVNWYPAAGASSYKLYYKAGTAVDTSNGAPDTTVTGSQIMIRGLTNDTMYAFAVVAVNAAGESGPSTIRLATPHAGIVAPSAPALTSATPGDGSVVVTWDTIATATSYNLYYGTGLTVSATAGIAVTGAHAPLRISNLTDATTYSFAVSAVNEGGESELSAPLSVAPSSNFAVAAVTDTDGNVYLVDTIGSQVWMVENLKTTRFNDGTPIPLVTGDVPWTALVTPGYCWSGNDSSTNKKTYGALYNWYAVHTGKLAPKGWHVASDSDWGVLVGYLGGDSKAGAPLKEAGMQHWLTPNAGATNMTGFSALPGGFRYDFGAFATIGSYGHWWSSTAFLDSDSWCRFMDSGTSAVTRSNMYKNYGLSVRCVHD